MAWERGSRYPRILTAIVLAYAAIIALDDSLAGGVVRLLLLGYLLWEASRLRETRQGRTKYAGWVAIGLGLVAVVVAAVVGPGPLTSGLIGGVSFVFTAIVITILARVVIDRKAVDTAMVLGVLAVYLLLALLFASLNQLLNSFSPVGYLNGVTGLAGAADQRYFSVITLATVGDGDITPASQGARAVAVVEALTGQIYLVSVVAAVVGGWHRRT